MSLKKTQAENDSRDPIIVEAQRYRDQRANTYREQALKIYPWICARCGRESQDRTGASAARSFASLRSITGTITTTTIHPMGATGNCCVSTVTKTSTRGSR